MGLHKIKKFLYIRRNTYQNQGTIHRMGENPCQLFNNNRLIYIIYKKLKKTSRTGGMAQAVKCLLCRYKARSLNPNPTNKQKQK
jgi:hypothetical protein